MINSATAAVPAKTQPQRAIENTGMFRGWIEAWKTVICAEVLSAFTKCEEIVVDPLLRHF
jgi:hypothetical protein